MLRLAVLREMTPTIANRGIGVITSQAFFVFVEQQERELVAFSALVLCLLVLAVVFSCSSLFLLVGLRSIKIAVPNLHLSEKNGRTFC